MEEFLFRTDILGNFNFLAYGDKCADYMKSYCFKGRTGSRVGDYIGRVALILHEVYHDCVEASFTFLIVF